MIPDLPDLHIMRHAAAQAAIVNPELLPIFERIEQDYRDAQIAQSDDPVAALRAQIERDRKDAA